MKKFRYCSLSRKVYFYHYAVANEHLYDEFNDEYYNELMKSLKTSGNEKLIEKQSDEVLRSEAEAIWTTVWNRC